MPPSKPTRPERRRPQLRRGAAYLVALAGATIVAAMLVGASLALRVQHARADALTRPGQTRLAALSALEVAAQAIESDADWDSDAGGGDWFTLSLAGSTITVTAVDSKGGDPVDGQTAVITAAAANGETRQVYSMSTRASSTPLDCLDNALMAGGALDVSGTLNADKVVSSNGTATCLLGRINAPVEALLTVGLGFNGGAKSGIAHTLPSSSDVISKYTAIATPIVYSLIPSGDITGKLFSPSSNPFGVSTNPRGVYLIDCGGNRIRISNTRIYGTLVILNAGAGSRVSGGVVWNPADASLASLVVQGSFEFAVATSDRLSEVSLSMNFNPTGAPYGGVTDADKLDQYTPELAGLFYITGAVTMSSAFTGYSGEVIAGAGISVSAGSTITYRTSLLTTPPLGFTLDLSEADPTTIARIKP